MDELRMRRAMEALDRALAVADKYYVAGTRQTATSRICLLGSSTDAAATRSRIVFTEHVNTAIETADWFLPPGLTRALMPAGDRRPRVERFVPGRFCPCSLVDRRDLQCCRLASESATATTECSSAITSTPRRIFQCVGPFAHVPHNPWCMNRSP